MLEVTRILNQIESGDPSAAEHLLPLVYDELRKLAACRLAQEKTGQTLQATALVHEAYLRLVGNIGAERGSGPWNSRGHFFGAAAEAMRRILVEITARPYPEDLDGCGSRQRLVDYTDFRVVKTGFPPSPIAHFCAMGEGGCEF